MNAGAIVEAAAAGRLPGPQALDALAAFDDLPALLAAAAHIRDRHYGEVITYSPKVFIPLTRLCRDVCHYCTFAHPPRAGEPAYLSIDEVLGIARAGAAAGCHEALFTLGDKPELRYAQAREALAALGCASTIEYVERAARAVFEQTGLLPHLNPGVMSAQDYARLRPVSVSMGLMLESSAERLCERGGPHFGSPDKQPAVRLESIDLAGAAAVPFTSGILMGIGETRRERLEALFALRALHERHGHLQEIIVQNFRAKPGTRMQDAEEPVVDEELWTIAMARIVFGAEVSVQAPPNLQPGALDRLLAAGINDWGGVSPVTPDHVNPEAPWPERDALAAATAAGGKVLAARLPVYPPYIRARDRWIDPKLHTAVLRAADAELLARDDPWSPGAEIEPPALTPLPAPGLVTGRIGAILDRAVSGATLSQADVVDLFAARGPWFDAVRAAADAVRREVNGDTVTYVVNRNINYTNVCYFRCQFCAFSKGKTSENLRGEPYVVEREELQRRVSEAWDRGATEVCLQGGIHPDYTGATYIDVVKAVKEVQPAMHVHAFSPLEIWQGAHTLGVPLAEYLAELRALGLGSLPGTAAEILDDEVRAIICPDKIDTGQWFQVMAAAHAVGLRSTSTVMFGHVEDPQHWARHLLRLRAQQADSGGFTEFVPLPFVPMEAPMYLKGRARRGPTFREAVLMHAVARLALHPLIPNIQASWVKLGPAGVAACLDAGANDLGGTLMNESISRAAGASHGQEMPPAQMQALIAALGRTPRQRNTLYGEVAAERIAAGCRQIDLAPIVNTPARQFLRRPERGTDARTAAR
ncbi:MAG: 5-amino-6-(D-ribitylamino)uracil--L-tyrosine 4-hydroxyphenyl transferase CofH [Gammaproteobacteria bacterium]